MYNYKGIGPYYYADLTALVSDTTPSIALLAGTGLTGTAPAVDSWQDQSGNANHFISRPSHTITRETFGNITNSVRFSVNGSGNNQMLATDGTAANNETFSILMGFRTITLFGAVNSVAYFSVRDAATNNYLALYHNEDSPNNTVLAYFDQNASHNNVWFDQNAVAYPQPGWTWVLFVKKSSKDSYMTFSHNKSRIPIDLGNAGPIATDGIQIVLGSWFGWNPLALAMSGFIYWNYPITDGRILGGLENFADRFLI